MKWASILMAGLLCLPAFAQTTPDKEQESLQRAIAEAGNSPIDFVRALEDHLNHFPNSPRKVDLERAIVKSSVELKDNKRIILYGERVLAVQPDDLQLLQQVSNALLRQEDKAGVARALGYARHLEEMEREIAKTSNLARMSSRDAAQRKDDTDKGTAAALILESRAEGILGNNDAAIQLAEKSFQAYPSVEAAREAANWYAAAGKNDRAVQKLADAFSISELRSPDGQRADDRTRLGELYRKLKGNEVGLGDLILQAYDRTAETFAERRTAIRALDPNNQLSDPMQFTLTGVDGEKLKLNSLLGKIVVMDFWATWCGPCRIQHPLYEQVKGKFKNRDDVVFLALDTDEDRSLVKPFLVSSGWTNKVYFDEGLQFALRVGSIPTTLIFGKKGTLVSRMEGFLPDRFVDMLSERIQEALGVPAGKPLEVSTQ